MKNLFNLSKIHGEVYIKDAVKLPAGTYLMRKSAKLKLQGIPFEIVRTFNFLNDNEVEITVDENFVPLLKIEYTEIGTLPDFLTKFKKECKLAHPELIKQYGAKRNDGKKINPFSMGDKQATLDSGGRFTENGLIYPYSTKELITAVMLMTSSNASVNEAVAFAIKMVNAECFEKI